MLEHIKKNNEIMKQADGFYRLEKDKEAIALFLEEIEKKTNEIYDIRRTLPIFN